MEHFKKYILHNFEQIFVLLVLVTTAGINFYIPYKLAFLNFYFLPIILGGYYLGKRQAVLGALFCTLAVMGFVFLRTDLFYLPPNELTIYAQVLVWGGFLILSGFVVGGLRESLDERIKSSEQLNQDLLSHQDELSRANAALKDYNENLEHRVKDRTIELEQSRNSMETIKQKVEGALYATMDPAVVNLMIEGQLKNEKRDVSLLFSDLVNFTAYSENNPPEVVIGDLNRFLRDVEPIILAYRGHIDKYMGDGIMCEFGAPINFPTYRSMAVIAGLKLQQQIKKLDYPWEMRLGIASGPAFVGLIGFKRQTYTAIGDVVNLASRLEKACTPGNVLIDRNTYDAVSYCVEAHKKRQLGVKDADIVKEMELEKLHDALDAEPDNADLHYKIARIHLELQEPADALAHVERALELDPLSTDFKVLYAEVGLKAKEMERISVKGKKRRIEAFEIVGLKDPLLNRDKIPESFYREFKDVAELIKIPDDLVLPVETLDDSIGHSRVVAVLSYVLAGRAGLSEREKMDVLNAAFLADIGKEVVPPHVLNRSGGLTSNEMEIVKQHPTESGRALRKLGYENPAMIQIVTHAHECWNGSGYPNALRGNDIPLGARIVGLADTYDALTSRRAYREPWARMAALAEIRRETEAGIFDPTLVMELEKLIGNSR